MKTSIKSQKDSAGGVRLKPATVFPLEIYSEQRIKEFDKEDKASSAEQHLLQKLLNN